MEPRWFGAAEPGLPVGHRRPAAVDSQHSNSIAPPRVLHRSTGEGERAGGGARVHDRSKRDVVDRDGVSVELVAGQRKLREHDHPRTRGQDGLGVHRRVAHHVVRDAGWLHRGDQQRRTHLLILAPLRQQGGCPRPSVARRDVPTHAACGSALPPDIERL